LPKHILYDVEGGGDDGRCNGTVIAACPWCGCGCKDY